MKIVLFLGAGASIQFGNPATKEFKDLLIQNGNVDERIKPILNFKSFPDIEYVLQCLKEILESKDGKLLGQFLASDNPLVTIQSQPNISFRDLYSIGAGPYNQIMQELFQTYQIEDEKKPLLKNFFQTLFDLISKYSDSIEVGTTNYDLAVETFCNLPGSNYQCIDGFQVGGNGYFWSPNLLNQSFDLSRGKFVKLYKIHGSLDWQGNGSPKKLGAIPNFEPSGASLSTVIAPTLSPKHEYEQEPFSLLLQYFSKKLMDSDVCIVIGFSFRDREISKHFEEYVKNGKHLIVVSPNCHRDYLENLFQVKKVYSDNDTKKFANTHAVSKNRHVNLIDLPFEGNNDQKVFEYLENYLK